MATPKRNSTLLIVDDDPSMVRLLTKVLGRSLQDKINIESLTDPVEARERINNGGIDILITDLEMPGINGLELLRCAKRRNVCTQVLFLTGHSTQEALLDAFELGATDYLLKPIDQEQVIELIDQSYIRLRRWQRALADTWQQQSELAAAVKD